MSQCSCERTDNREDVMAYARQALPEDILKHIEKIRREDPDFKSRLISVLHMVQGHFGYLGRDQMDAVAQLMQIPAADVTGVATFYHFFRLKPSGRYLINICMGTACYVKGGAEIAQKLQDELGIEFGETTKDGIFTLEAARCLGTCGLAPVVMIGGNVHPKVKPEAIPALLASYREKEA